LCIDLNLIERNWLNGASHTDAFADAVRTPPNMLKMLRPAPCANDGNAKAAVQRQNNNERQQWAVRVIHTKA
jgi:hypothetical protein